MKSTRRVLDTSLTFVGLFCAAGLLLGAFSQPTPSKTPVKERVLLTWTDDIKVEIIFSISAAWKQIITAFPQKSP